jgi:anti-sigma B factor antagonist
LRRRLGFLVEVAPLVFETALEGAAALVILHGELDLSGAPPLEEEIERLAADPAVTRVVLDLRDLEFLDSSGLRLVALADRSLRDAGSELVLVRGSETVQRVFEITRMAERLTFVDSPAALDPELFRP